MATAHGQNAHPEVPRKTHRNGPPRFTVPPSQPQSSKNTDPFYGHETIARMSARFITHLFACPELPPAAVNHTHSHAKLPYFIAYALHRTKLHPSVTIAALVLLQRLKARFPTARGSSGHRLFISAFMIASKVICDDTYSNKSWSIVAQGMFALREVNQMEREMCSYLEWELTVDNPILSNFEDMVIRDFSSPEGPYPSYPLTLVSKRAAKAATSTSATPVPEPHPTTSPIPMFGQQRNPTPAKQPATPNSTSSRGTPGTPDTPSTSYSNTTSPASSASPATPVGIVDFSAKIRGYDSSPSFAISEVMPQVHPLKTKMFAFAIPSIW